MWYAYLCLFPDGEKENRIPMTFEWCDSNSLYYKVDIRLDSGLYWYKFYYTTETDGFFVSRTDTSKSYRVCDGGLWQLTVYEKNFITPTYLQGGLIYQIFPDRFNKSENAKVKTFGKFLRNDWGGLPAYLQEEGCAQLGLDFFGGNLLGITEKLPYIKSLSVNCIYLNPLFMSSSNHRYNTMNYEKIDPVLGTEEDFKILCNEAHKLGISIILDGVFSHNGDDSIYFDKYGKNTDIPGAYTSKNSPYFSWYKFNNWPNDYSSWWGVPTLPEVNEDDENYLEYICGENGILRYWIRMGADGWRLDVADELPDVFLDKLRLAVKAENPNAFIIGEVWEDASNKISYSARRRYFGGRQLDSVMNYPFATAIIDFVRGGDAAIINETVLTVCENYPKQCVDLLMNHIGTHDTARIINVLGYNGDFGDRKRQATLSLTAQERERGIKLLCLAAVLSYTLPGIPSLYYGDEAGLEGFADPFCRGCYPWGRENTSLIDFYKKLGKIRQETPMLKDGIFIPQIAENGIFAFKRENNDGTLLVAVNATNAEGRFYVKDFLKSETIYGAPLNGSNAVLPPYSFALYQKLK